MPWFAAHAIMYFRFKDGNQDRYPVWENVYLIEAGDFEEAKQKGRNHVMRATGDSDGTLRWDDRPAAIEFAGLRKVLSVAHMGDEGRLSDGDEITYTEFEIANARAFEQFVAGEVTPTMYVG